LAGDIELGSLEVGRVRFEVFYTTTRKGTTGGGEGREEAVVWSGFIWIRLGEVGVVEGIGLMGGRVNGVFRGVCHDEKKMRRICCGWSSR